MNMRHTLAILIALSLAHTAPAQTPATQIPATQPFGRPLIPDMVADPSISEVDGVFYCYATTDGTGGGLSRSGTPVVWTSRDFVNWSFEGSSFQNWNAKYWAPSTLVPHKGQFYSFPTIDNQISVVVAPTPVGPFRTPDGKDIHPSSGWKPFAMKQEHAIDAEVLVDDDGQAYMVWSRRRAARLSPDLLALDGPEINIPTKRPGYSEGPFLFKRKGVYYYLYTLAGHEDYHYAYMMSRVSPLGPWEAPAEDIIARTDVRAGIYGPGHGCFFSPRGSDQWYFIHLEFGRGGTTRQIYAQKMNFNEDGTIQPIRFTNQGVGALRPVVDPRPNLALGKTATASTTRADLKVKPIAYKSIDRVETYHPNNALDDSNGSRWMADEKDARPSFTVDLGEVRDIHRTQAYFVQPTSGHAYLLESSVDAKTWERYGGHDEVILRSPHIDTKATRARYLRLTITHGAPGLWEFRVD